MCERHLADDPNSVVDRGLLRGRSLLLRRRFLCRGCFPLPNHCSVRVHFSDFFRDNSGFLSFCRVVKSGSAALLPQCVCKWRYFHVVLGVRSRQAARGKRLTCRRRVED